MADHVSLTKKELKRLIAEALEEELAKRPGVVYVEEAYFVVDSPTNINVNNSQIGVLNTGSISNVEKIDVNIGALNQAGNEDISNALRALTEAILEVDEADAPEDKEKLLDQVSFLSEQATLPTDGQNKGVISATIDNLAALTGALGGVATAWTTWGPAITKFFGI